MRHTYNKIVRDRIPEIIAANGRQCGVQMLDERSYGLALLDKLVEEVQGVRDAEPVERITNLADVLEVSVRSGRHCASMWQPCGRCKGSAAQSLVPSSDAPGCRRPMTGSDGAQRAKHTRCTSYPQRKRSIRSRP